MVELIIFALLICLTGVMTLVKSLQFVPNTTSEYELRRRADAGDTHASHELTRRSALPVFEAVQKVTAVLLVVLLVAIAFLGLAPWLAALSVVLLFLLAEAVQARGWFTRVAVAWQPKIERATWSHVPLLKRLFTPFVRPALSTQFNFASAAELRQLIQADQGVLQPADKDHLLGALNFSTAKLKDHMVPREQIVTVDISETVGPLLLDRLHKTSHNIFVVVKKDLSHLKGLLYMSDLVPLDPEVKTVKDALRPTMYYLPEKAQLLDVLAASLKTGRQFFLVVDTGGKIVGLMTLRDALQQLLGRPLPADVLVATSPDKLS